MHSLHSAFCALIDSYIDRRYITPSAHNFNKADSVRLHKIYFIALPIPKDVIFALTFESQFSKVIAAAIARFILVGRIMEIRPKLGPEAVVLANERNT